MKQNAWIAILVLVLLGLAANAHAVIPPERSNHCPPDPDSGWIVCRSTCEYPNKCVYNTANPVGSYCWQAALVNGYPANVCHSGDYDPCCDPNYQW